MRKFKVVLAIISVLLAAILLIGCGDSGEDVDTSSSPDYPERPVDSNAETYIETDINGDVVTDEIGGGDPGDNTDDTPGTTAPGGTTPGGTPGGTPSGTPGGSGTHTGGGSVGLTYKTDIIISLEQGMVTEMMFANPNRSADNISIVLYVDGFKVAQSGILVPGTQLTTMTLNEVGKRAIKNIGVYDGKFLVEFYNGVTNEKAVVNTEIPIRVIVVN